MSGQSAIGRAFWAAAALALALSGCVAGEVAGDEGTGPASETAAEQGAGGPEEPSAAVEAKLTEREQAALVAGPVQLFPVAAGHAGAPRRRPWAHMPCMTCRIDPNEGPLADPPTQPYIPR